MQRVVRKFMTDARGASALEFALIALPLVVFSVGIIEFGRYVLVHQEIGYAADRVARVLYLGAMTDSEIQLALKANLVTFDPDNLTATVTRDVYDTSEDITISINFAFNFIAPIMPYDAMTLTHERIVSTPR